MKPILSVITVVYNNVDFIHEAINSVLSETLPSIEYIIIDGKSTDGTVSVIESYGLKITKFVSARDNGLYDAMNKGVSIATGDYVSFINADDYYVPEALGVVVKNLMSQSPDVLYADLDYINNEKQVQRCWRPGKFNPDNLKNLWIPPHPTTFIRRKLIIKAEGFDLKYKLAADYDLILKVLSGAEKVIYLDTVLVKMRLGGATNVSWENIIKQNVEIFMSYKRQFNRYPVLKFFIKLVNRFYQVNRAKKFRNKR
jgi:glycosyltransferase